MEVGLEVGMEVNVEGVHLQMEVCWWLAQLECGDNDTKARRSIKIHGRAAWKGFLTSVLCLVQISTDIDVGFFAQLPALNQQTMKTNR